MRPLASPQQQTRVALVFGRQKQPYSNRQQKHWRKETNQSVVLPHNYLMTLQKTQWTQVAPNWIHIEVDLKWGKEMCLQVEALLDRTGGQAPMIGYVVGQFEALGYHSWAHRVVSSAGTCPVCMSAPDLTV